MQEFPLKIKEGKSLNSQEKKRLESGTLKSALVFFFPVEMANQDTWRENTKPHYTAKPNFKKMFEKGFSFFSHALTKFRYHSFVNSLCTAEAVELTWNFLA